MTTEPRPDLRGKLEFQTDKGAGRLKWLAILLAFILVGCMGSGFVNPSKTEEVDVAETKIKPVTVKIMTSKSEGMQLVLTADGQSIQDRSTSIKAEASEQVVSVNVEWSALVQRGHKIGPIDNWTIGAQLRQSQAQLEQTSTL